MKKIFSPLVLVLFALFGVLSTSAQVSIVNPSIPYSQDFNSLANTGTTNAITTVPAGWTFLESGKMPILLMQPTMEG